MRWGSWGANLSTLEMQKCIETALSLNFSTFDHADIYGDYCTEKDFGRAISELDLQREHYQLISKCGIKLINRERNQPIKSYDLSKEYILKSVDQSLKNLRTEYLDVLLLHRPSPLMNYEELAGAFQVLRSSGKVRDFGVSNFSVQQFEDFYSYFPFLITNQIEISLNNTERFFDGSLDLLKRKGCKPTAWSVLGDYFINPDSKQNQNIKKEIGVLTEKYNCKENQILIAFLRKHPSGIIPIVGTSKKETITQLHDGLKVELSTEDWFKLLEASRGKEVD